ncbi:MAG: alpha/beta hydrolase [Planctomycetaceae bacterium]
MFAKPLTSIALLFALAVGVTTAGAATPEVVPGPYMHGPDSSPQEGVPRGKVSQFELTDSKVFPGTKRRYSVYVPAQYDSKTPAALMVFQDGHAYESGNGDFRVATVFDNLIHQQEMPVTIAVMIDPGHRKDLPEKRGWNPRPENRSVEYDTVSDDYAKFLLEDVLPVIEADLNITKNPELRAICGMSSGGICAFGVAWHRPDSFRKVMSHIGSFTDIRGGYVYAPMARKEKKPIRVFLQDGSNDLDNQFGNWPLANQTLANSLEFAKYEVKFVYGDGEHNGLHGGTIFPDSLRWLWSGWEEQKP